MRPLRSLTRARHARGLASSALKDKLIKLMPEKQAAFKALKKEHGAKIVDKVTIDQLVGARPREAQRGGAGQMLVPRGLPAVPVPH